MYMGEPAFAGHMLKQYMRKVKNMETNKAKQKPLTVLCLGWLGRLHRPTH
jgi:hypothetical protein